MIAHRLMMKTAAPPCRWTLNSGIHGGVQYDWSENVTVGLFYDFIDAGSASVDVDRGPLAGRLKGDFKTNNIQAVNVNVIWRF